MNSQLHILLFSFCPYQWRPHLLCFQNSLWNKQMRCIDLWHLQQLQQHNQVLRTWQSEQRWQFPMRQSTLCLTKTDPLTKTAIIWGRKACASAAEHVVPLTALGRQPARRLGCWGIRKGFLNDHILNHIQLILPFSCDWYGCFLRHENNNCIFKMYHIFILYTHTLAPRAAHHGSRSCKQQLLQKLLLTLLLPSLIALHWHLHKLQRSSQNWTKVKLTTTGNKKQLHQQLPWFSVELDVQGLYSIDKRFLLGKKKTFTILNSIMLHYENMTDNIHYLLFLQI